MFAASSIRHFFISKKTLVIAKMPLTSLGLHGSHHSILLCLLPGLPMLHASHKVYVQDELLAGDANAYC